MVKPPLKQPGWVDDFFSFHASQRHKGSKVIADHGREAFKRSYKKFAHAVRGQEEEKEDKPKKKVSPLATAVRAIIKKDADVDEFCGAAVEQLAKIQQKKPAEYMNAVKVLGFCLGSVATNTISVAEVKAAGASNDDGHDEELPDANDGDDGEHDDIYDEDGETMSAVEDADETT